MFLASLPLVIRAIDVRSKGQIGFRRAICQVVGDEGLWGGAVEILILICFVGKDILCAACDALVMLHMFLCVVVCGYDVALSCTAVKFT